MSLVDQLREFGVRSVDVTDTQGLTHAFKLDDIEEIGNASVTLTTGATINGLVKFKGEPGRIHDYLGVNIELEAEIVAQTIVHNDHEVRLRHYTFYDDDSPIGFAEVRSISRIGAARLLSLSGYIRDAAHLAKIVVAEEPITEGTDPDTLTIGIL